MPARDEVHHVFPLGDADEDRAKQAEPLHAFGQAVDDFGIDLAMSNGDTSNELPVPATFVVEPSGRIAFAHYDPNWGVRLDPAVLISILEKVAGELIPRLR